MSEKADEPESIHHVRIHIDRTPHRSPNPTDGEALYALGDVKPGHVLYQEVQGDEEDRLVPGGKERVLLQEDEHFWSGAAHKKVFTVFVNGRPKEVDHKVVTYPEVVTLSGIPGDAITTFLFHLKRGAPRG